GDDAGWERLGRFERSALLLRPLASHLDQLRSLVERLDASIRADRSLLRAPAAAARIQSELAAAARLVLGAPRPARAVAIAAGRPVVPREQIFRSAKALWERFPDELLTVEDLALAAHVSVRTLRTAFLEYLGVAPLRYLKLRRLHQVRGALRA